MSHFTRPPSHLKRLLVIRLDNMGDVLMCTPAFHAIRHGLPSAEICLLASPSGAQLFHHLDDIDEVIPFKASWVKQGSAQGDDELALIKRLMKDRFDAAIILTAATQSALPAALLTKMVGIPVRLAYSRENPYALLTHWVREQDVIGPGMRHEVERQLALVGELGFERPPNDWLRFKISPADEQEAQALLLSKGLHPKQPYVVIHPGATAASRCYPASDFGRVADQLMDEGMTCLFCAGADEVGLVQQAQASMRQDAIDCSGQMTLGGLAALIRGAKLLIANNSGASHIASAVGTPIVCLYALTNPQHTPWRAVARVLNHRVECQNCLQSICPHLHHACLRGVPPEQVVHAANDLMGLRRLIPGQSGGTPPLTAGVQHALSCQN